MKKQEIIDYSKYENEEVTNEIIEDIFFRGEYEELLALSKNKIFKDIDPELILSFSKIKEVVLWYQSTQNKIVISFILLILGFVFKFYSFINFSFFAYIIYLYYFKQKKDKKKEVLLEQERRNYILSILEKSQLSKLNLNMKSKFSSAESHTHTP